MAKAKTTDPVNSNLIQKISVDHLFFDPDNPRLPEEVDGSDETAVLRWLLNEGNGLLPELMGSIAQQGFFPGEPLLVAPRGPKHPDDYVVVEGNRRLAAVKLILAPSKAEKYTKTVNDTADSCKNPAALQMLPSVVYPTRDSVLRYLGFRHVTGVKEWGALAKAKYSSLDKRACKKGELAQGLGNVRQIPRDVKPIPRGSVSSLWSQPRCSL